MGFSGKRFETPDTKKGTISGSHVYQLMVKFFYANNESKKQLHFDTLHIHNSVNIALIDMNSVINLLQN
jgi:hypothetical protein